MNEPQHVSAQEFRDTLHELEAILQTLVLNDSSIIDALAQMLGSLQQMQSRAEQLSLKVEKSQTELAHEINLMRAKIPDGGGSRRITSLVADSDPFSRENPEAGLLQHLYSFLDDTRAIDVGAHIGDFAERLLSVGYRVDAFEPYAPSFQRVEERLRGRDGFTVTQIAIGPRDGEATLRIAADLSTDRKWTPSLFNSIVDHPMLEEVQFRDSAAVAMRSLESLRLAKQIPGVGGVLKIDTEGFDLQVIEGMGECRYTIVMTEFWNSEHPFGLAGHGRLEDLVAAMRRRGYAHHLVFYHLDESATISYYCDRADSIAKSWGNALFFLDSTLLAKALTWCEAVLPPTYRP